jgi:molybdopterin converting factor small subunit
MVTIRLLGNLTTASGESLWECEVKEPTPIRQVLLDHRDEIPEVIALWEQENCMFTVGTKIAADTTVIKDGDTLKVTPHNAQLNAADFPIGHGGTQ